MAPLTRRGLEREHLARVVRQMAGELLAVLVQVVETQRAGRVLGKAQQGQSLVQGRSVHLGGRVRPVRVFGVGVQIDCYHVRLSQVRGLPEKDKNLWERRQAPLP